MRTIQAKSNKNVLLKTKHMGKAHQYLFVQVPNLTNEA